jgi:putative acetyltransferase
MIKTIRTDSNHPGFIALVKLLDAELAERDGTEHSFYDQFNKIANLKQVIVAYENHEPVSCGAIKEYIPTTMEVKRMYTIPEHRGKGFAAIVLKELEAWAREMGYKTCVLETGKRQPEAIRLYEKNGYNQISNYGQYVGVENSLCFEKQLT